MTILLDTNAYTILMGGDPHVAELVRAAERVMLSVVVLGELLYGFRYGTRFEQNLAQMNAFIQSHNVTILTVGPDTAEHYSRIATALRAKGRPIPQNDTWIAAHAMETGSVLVSADAHFEHVDGIALAAVGAPP